MEEKKRYRFSVSYTTTVDAEDQIDATREVTDRVWFGSYKNEASVHGLAIRAIGHPEPAQNEALPQPPAVEGEIEPVPFAPTPHADALEAVERVTSRPVELSCEEAGSLAPVTAADDIPF